MATVQDLITEALLELGVISAEETPEAVILNRSLRRFQSMLGEWQLNGLPIPNSTGTGTFDIDGATLATEGPPATWQEAIILSLAVSLGPGHGKRGGQGLSEATIGRAINLYQALHLRNSAADTTVYADDTWGWLITDALQNAGAIKEGDLPSTAQMSRGLRQVKFLLEDWTRGGLPSLPATPTILLTAAVNLPAGYSEAVRLNLILQLAPSYGMATEEIQIVTGRAVDALARLRERSSVPAPATDFAANTWGWIARDALQNAGAIKEGETPSSSQLARGLQQLSFLLADWTRSGIPSLPDGPYGAATVHTLPAGYGEAVRLNLALQLAPSYGMATEEIQIVAGRAGDALARLHERSSAPAPAPQTTQWGWLIADALQTAGAIKEGQVPSTDQLNRGLQHLTFLLRDWQRRGVANLPDPPAATTELVTLPIGYEEAVRLNLAVALAPSYSMSQDEFAVALTRSNESFLSLRRRNSALVSVIYQPNTWGWVIENAFRELSVIGDGERISIEQQARGLEHLVEILEQWALSDLLLTGPQRFPSYLFASNNIKQSYTIGTGPDMDIMLSPPSRITTVEYRRVGAQEGRPLGAISYHDWSEEYWTGSFIPRQYYYESTWPAATLYLDQMPTAGDSMLITGWAREEAPAVNTLTSRVDSVYPPGYARAFWLTLAVDLAASYPEARLTEMTVRDARESRYLVKRRNRKPSPIRLDSALLGRQSGTYYRNHYRRL